MNALRRAMNILIKPKQEWQGIAEEQPDASKVLGAFVIPWTVLASILFVGKEMLLNDSIDGSVITVFIVFIAMIVITVVILYIEAHIVNAMAESFGSRKDFGRAFQLVAYAFAVQFLFAIPEFVLALFDSPTAIGVLLLSILLGIVKLICFIYVVYTGLPVIMLTPNSKRVPYMVTLAVTMAILVFSGMIVTFLIGGIVSNIFA